MSGLSCGEAKLAFWRWVLWRAWTLDYWADGLVEWAQQKYSDELHGIGSIEQ